MALIRCPSCGKQLMDSATKCPGCGHSFVFPTISKEETVKEPYDRKREETKVMSFLLSYDGTEYSLRNMCGKVCDYFRTEFAGEVPQKEVLQIVNSAFGRTIGRLKELQKQNDAKARAALKNFNLVLNSNPYQGLGFSVVTDTAGAIAYAALDALEQQSHELNQTRKAYAQLAEDLAKVNNSYKINLEDIQSSIQYAFSFYEGYWASCAFVEENRAFYEDDRFDLGMEIDGNNVYQLLREVCLGQEPYLRLYWDDKRRYQPLADRGYLLCEDIYRDSMFVCTTGKYERWAMQQLYNLDHPEEMAAQEQQEQENNKRLRHEAELALTNQEYHRAAKLLGQSTDDEDIRQSIRIWNTYLPELPAKEYYRFTSISGERIDVDKKWPVKIPEGIPERQHMEFYKAYITLGMDGHIYVKDDDKQLGGVEKVWSNVIQLVKDVNCLYALHQEGHISRIQLGSYAKSLDVSQWRNVVKLFWYPGILVGLTAEKKLLLVTAEQKLEKRFAPCLQWQNVEDVIIGHYIIAALTEDGRVLVAEDAYYTQFDEKVSKWRNIVRLEFVDSDRTLLGITDTGLLLNTYSEEYMSGRENLKSMKNLVRFTSDWTALRADGKLISYDHYDDALVEENREDVVDQIKTSKQTITVYADGTISGLEGSDGQTIGPERLFRSIDTILQERREVYERLLERKREVLGKTSALFAKKKKLVLENDIAFLEREIAKFL